MTRYAMGLPPLYTCFVCGEEVNEKSQHSVRRVRAWVRVGKKTIHRIVDEEPVFAHDYCLDSKPDDSQTALF
jgi:hypothetical protein